MKRRGQRIVMVTAYDAPGGRLADAAGIDIILVGDSAAMVVLGHDSTVPATVDEMLVLTKAVTRGAATAARRRRHAVRLLPGLGRGGARQRDPVREGGRRGRGQARGGRRDALARARARGRGDPRHGPCRPDAAVRDDARRVQAQGRTAEKARRLPQDARALEAAGCFAIVLEAVPAQVAARITSSLSVPTIGIGAGADCDGQVLVFHDLLGFTTARRRGSSSATPTSRRETRSALERVRRRCALGRVPRRSTRTPCRGASSPPSRRLP